MTKTTIIKKAAFVAGLVGLGYGIYYCWLSLPIATGYGAKVLGSALFVAGRKVEDIKAQELSFAPVHLVSHDIDYQDSSVTSSLWGLAKRKAIFRQGLGTTLVRELTEKEIRSQPRNLPVRRPMATDTLPWPAGDKIAYPLPAPVDTARLAAALADVFKENDSIQIQTRAVVVLYKGQLVAEKYAPGFSRTTRLAGWSMAKSITNALIGVLVKQNKLQLNQPAPVPEWRQAHDPRRAITVRHLLQQTSGLDFEEHYGKSSDATRMLFQTADMGAYAASQPLLHPPGTVFQYTSGNSNILSRLIRHTVGERDYHAFPYEQLFYKIGMYSALLEPDASGTFVGSSYSFATARDWARFGLLYLNDGVAGQERILPAGWVKQTTTPAGAAPIGEYGFHFWLNAGAKDNPADRKFPSLPADMFYANGVEGQNIFIIPSEKLVVVRLGLTRKGKYDAETFLANIIQSIHE
jgi:CubicO group peptidase (beta-lactamase class C family)